jgi:K+-sensing histidine kinase KdpD
MRTRPPQVVGEIVLGVANRERDTTLVQRAGRLAKRLNADFTVVHVAAPNQSEDSPVLRTLAQTTRMSDGTWVFESAADAARGLVRVASARPGSTVVVEGVRTKGGWLAPRTFAQRVLEAGANELLIFAPLT